MKRNVATNTFQNGLVMDFNPLVSPDGILTHCLNGTTLTFNGNENVLQNDMGNGRVETARLPDGYIPLGTTELGGIIYVVSYNPQTDKCQIGSFPSPERNISSAEINRLNGTAPVELVMKDLISTVKQENEEDRYIVKGTQKKLIFDNILLHPGDKFKIFGDSIYNISKFLSAYNTSDYNINKNPSQLKLRIAVIDDNGKITYLDNQLKWENILKTEDSLYYIGEGTAPENTKDDLDMYRDQLASQYTVFQSNVSGKLAIIAELEVINTFSVAWDCTVVNGNYQPWFFINWTYENELPESRPKINPKKVRITYKDSENGEISLLYDVNPKKVNRAVYSDTENEGIYTQSSLGEDRNNDGTDEDFLIRLTELKNGVQDNILFNKESGIVAFTITPIMEFGELEYLKQTINIDFGLVGEHSINQTQWKYFNDKNLCILNWGFDIYTNPNQPVNSATFKFYPLSAYTKLQSADFSKILSTSKLEKEISEYELTLEKRSFSGKFQNTFVFGQGIQKDRCYIVEICFNVGKRQEYLYRILYTSNHWNSKYATEDHFENLQLDLSIECTNSKIHNNLKTISPPNNIEKFKETPPEKDDVEVQNIVQTAQGSLTSEYTLRVKDGDVFKLYLTQDNISTHSKVLPINATKEYQGTVLRNKNDNTELLGDITITSDLSQPIKTIDNELQTITIAQNYIDYITTPIVFQYDKQDFLYPKRYLTPLTIKTPEFINIGMGEASGSSSSYLNTIITDRSEGLGYNAWNIDDPDISKLGDILTQIESTSKNYDIIPLIIWWAWIKHPNDNRYFGWGIKDELETGAYTKSTQHGAQIYLIRNGSGKFFAVSYRSGGEDTDVQLMYYADSNSQKAKDKYLGTLKSQYGNFYKAIPNANGDESIEAYIIGNINYYNDYKYQVQLGIDLKNPSVLIDDVNIDKNLINIPNLTIRTLVGKENLGNSEYTNNVFLADFINDLIFGSEIDAIVIEGDSKIVIQNLKLGDIFQKYDSRTFRPIEDSKFLLKFRDPNNRNILSANHGKIYAADSAKYKAKVQDGVIVFPDLVQASYEGVFFYAQNNYNYFKIQTLSGSVK